jgi:hypothetical protein
MKSLSWTVLAVALGMILCCGAVAAVSGVATPTAPAPTPTASAPNGTAPAKTDTAPAAERVEIESVSISVMPGGGGQANFSVASTGECRGGHLSGGPTPFVHEDKGKLTPEVTKQIMDAAAEVYASKAVSDPEVRKQGIAIIGIKPVKGEIKAYQRPFDGKYAEPALQRLDELLHKHHIGGW